ncbi:MAG: GPO family capsid scaffolding protein, partial [Rubrivivax sp.]
MPTKPKFFRVATEGATTDGRTIDRAFIEQMARNYNPQKYGARVWLEHIRGTYPDSDFRAYGDVTAVKAEEVEIDGKKKLALFAEIKPLPDLVKLTNEKKQKIYTSIEINPKFADSGEAYLVGLGVTDSPASLGTEILSFAAQNPNANPFAGKKQHPGNLFAETSDEALVFDEEEEDDGKFSKGLKAIHDALKRFNARGKKAEGEMGEVLSVVGDIVENMGELGDQYSAQAKDLAELRTQYT